MLKLRVGLIFAKKNIEMNHHQRIYSALESAPASRGKTLYLKYLDGVRLTGRQAALAKCCDCMCYHIDGREDCRMPTCPLYPFMPYKGKVAKAESKDEENGTTLAPVTPKISTSTKPEVRTRATGRNTPKKSKTHHRSDWGDNH